MNSTSVPARGLSIAPSRDDIPMVTEIQYFSTHMQGIGIAPKESVKVRFKFSTLHYFELASRKLMWSNIQDTSPCYQKVIFVSIATLLKLPELLRFNFGVYMVVNMIWSSCISVHVRAYPYMFVHIRTCSCISVHVRAYPYMFVYLRACSATILSTRYYLDLHIVIVLFRM